MSYRVMQRNRVRFHGPVFVCGSICVRDFVCVRAHMYFCTGVDLCKKFLQIFYLFKTWSGIMIMHVRDGTEQTETKQCLTHFLKRLRRNKQQRQTGKRIKDKFRKNRKEARDE